jgi:hypothetical protein
VFAVMNFSPDPQRVSFTERLHHGRYRDFESGRGVTVGPTTHMQLDPWSYRLLTAER